jgi:hypothetical protein
MKHNMYVIYDKAAQFYNKPFYMINNGLAMRAFKDLLDDPSTEIAKHPEDFVLFQVGEYEDTSATITTFEPAVTIARAHELKAAMEK